MRHFCVILIYLMYFRDFEKLKFLIYYQKDRYGSRGEI
jgi:hypothetical protein